MRNHLWDSFPHQLRKCMPTPPELSACVGEAMCRARELPAVALASSPAGSGGPVQNEPQVEASFRSTQLSPIADKSPLNSSMALTFGDSTKLGGVRLGFLGSFNYKSDYKYYEDVTIREYEGPQTVVKDKVGDVGLLRGAPEELPSSTDELLPQQATTPSVVTSKENNRRGGGRLLLASFQAKTRSVALLPEIVLRSNSTRLASKTTMDTSKSPEVKRLRSDR